jgi:hypothetical protein
MGLKLCITAAAFSTNIVLVCVGSPGKGAAPRTNAAAAGPAVAAIIKPKL